MLDGLTSVYRVAADQVELVDDLSYERSRQIVDELYCGNDPFRFDDDRETASSLLERALTICRKSDSNEGGPLFLDDCFQHWSEISHYCFNVLGIIYDEKEFSENVPDDLVKLSRDRALEIVNSVINAEDESTLDDLSLRETDGFGRALIMLNKASEAVSDGDDLGLIPNDFWQTVTGSLVNKFTEICVRTNAEEDTPIEHPTLDIRLNPLLELKHLLVVRKQKVGKAGVVRFVHKNEFYSINQKDILPHVRGQLEIHRTRMMKEKYGENYAPISYSRGYENQVCNVLDELKNDGTITRAYKVFENKNGVLSKVFEFIVTLRADGVLEIPQLDECLELNGGFKSFGFKNLSPGPFAEA